MKRLMKGILVTAVLCGCSAYDYLQFRENTGLMVIEKPGGYGSAKFGEVIAASSTQQSDFMAVSAGVGHQTLIYRLADKGVIDKLEVNTDQYPAKSDMDKRNPQDRGSGVSLAGLPSWLDREGNPLGGCFAIGEPEANQVSLFCTTQSNRYFNLLPPADNRIESFGHLVTSVRPVAGEAWLLVVASHRSFGLFSSPHEANGRSEMPMNAFPSGERIDGLAAGRVLVPTEAGEESLVYVAVGTVNNETKSYRVYVFIQTKAHATTLQQIECLEMPSEAGFGGSMTAGDLDGDGMDELVVADALVIGRTNNVHIYDGLQFAERYIAEQANTGPPNTCTGTVSPVATLVPREGDFDIECGKNCSFGGALAIGDIATDDAGAELVIAARDAEVEGEPNAGAVYIYRGWSKGAPTAGTTMYNNVELASQVIDSTPVGGNEFGAGLAIAPMGGRNELLIGAAGTGKLVVAFCTGVGENIKAGGDVTRDADGKVISTRCRP